ncbi:TPA: glycosyltransferase family 4 protein [Morganella morganii]|uniref:glycosyltransferase family 4 protein n=1 Tax=Morganella morganii TaxID=582 RepID=UPI0006621E7C|nr:glycosyltransferase family 4 protein [Morganella morganii]MBV7312636.1 glycosyltransferase family 4 protein [Morganella morganii]WOZ88253.1 glycosyltransferase family 4 protein [Morganella morganii]HDU8569217.1 glycosyltransferase family 4 protein [Morganella morganii]
MNILLINHYAGSLKHGMEYRPYYMSREWIKEGHSVTIISASYSHLRKKQPDSHILKEKIKEENIDGIRYIWIKTPEYKKNGIPRLINIFHFLFGIFKIRKKIITEINPDVIIASSTYPMDNILAHYLSKKTNARYIYEIHDLWPLSPIELGGMSPRNPFILLCQFSENYAYKHCDAVVSMLPNVQEHTSRHGLLPTKLHIVTNGIVETDWNQDRITEIPKSLDEKLIELKRNNKKIIGYAGSLGKPNAMNYLIDAASKMKDESQFHFIIVGSGLEKSNLLKKTKELNLNNVDFFDSIDKTSIPSLLERFDIAYIGWNKSNIYRFGIAPNKLFDYMMAKCIILHSVSAGNDLVKDAECGLSVEAENPDKIRDAIHKLSNLSIEEKLKMKSSAYKFVTQNYTYSILSKKFLEVMKNGN